MRLGGEDHSLADLRQVYLGPVTPRPARGWKRPVGAAADSVARILARGEPAYGINTGFGKLAQTRIPPQALERLQLNVILSHCVGVGDPLPGAVVRLAIVLKLASLMQGHSGVRIGTVEALVQLLRHDALPVIPGQGSVGASGDLAPLSHLAAALLGHGEIDLAGERLPAAEALARIGARPLVLAAKEGVALINGTQISTALALGALFEAERVFAAALVAGALSVDAAAGSDAPFDARVHALRRFESQQQVAAALRALLAGSRIRESHRHGDPRVQDPYCLRCQPQVMGACLGQMRHVAWVLTQEAAAVTDNPLVFAGSDEVISGGNFHAEPVALAADALAVAIAEVGALAERRIALLIDASLSGLPAFLTRDPGLNSGFMIAHVTAAALASENKSLAHPASVDSLPTSANQEDHVSMATFAARRLFPMIANVRRIVAIELLAAAQGVDLRAPTATSTALAKAVRTIRERSPMLRDDRALSSDIEAVARLIADGRFTAMVPAVRDLLPSHAR